jgi:hypothetical protein
MTGFLTFTSLLCAWGSTGVNWQSDYAMAAAKAAELKKPLVVFLGHGVNGANDLVTDGGLTASGAKTLNDDYVAVYVNVDAPAGKELAKSFEMTEGVVISDRAGAKQAVRIDGPVSQSEMTEVLATYAQPGRVATTTEYRGRTRTPIRTIVSYPFQVLGGSTGTCRTGNCPNR